MNLSPTVAVAGMASVDTMILADRYPPEGAFAMVSSMTRMPGGTAANSAVAAARLGARVSFHGRVGADAAGDEIARALERNQIDIAGLLRDPGVPTDESIVVVSAEAGERTILWKQGARLTRGCRIDVDRLFAAGVCLIDLEDLSLYRFLADLPVHTNPAASLLGTLAPLAGEPALAMAEIIPRLDAIVGSGRDAEALTGTRDVEEAYLAIQRSMRGSNLRFAVVTDGPRGAFGITPYRVLHVSATSGAVVDTTGAGDAYAGALAYALAARWGPEDVLRLCSAVAGRCVSRLGAQTALPTLEEANALMACHPPAVTEL